MNVARQTASRLHHFRAIQAGSLPNGLRRQTPLGGPLGELPELLADPLVEVRARQLSQAADRLLEADLELVARRQLPRRLAVERDLDGLAPRRVANLERVVGRHDQRARGEGVRRDEADHVSLHAPRQDRPGVGEVVARRPGGRRGHQPVAADAPHLLVADRVRELCHAPVGSPDEADVVERHGHLHRQVDPERGQVHSLEVAAEGAPQTVLELLALDRGEEADRAEVDAEDRHPGLGEPAQRVEDAAVAAEDDADVRPLPVLDPARCPRRSVAVLLVLVGRADQLDRGLLAPPSAAGDDRVRGGLGMGVGDQHRPGHGSTSCERRVEIDRLAAPRRPDEGLAIPLGTGQARRGQSAHDQALLLDRLRDLADRLAAVARRRGRRRPSRPSPCRARTAA